MLTCPELEVWNCVRLNVCITSDHALHTHIYICALISSSRCDTYGHKIIIYVLIQNIDNILRCIMYHAMFLIYSLVHMHPWMTTHVLEGLDLFIYLRFYVAFNTVQVISRWVVGRAEETSTYSSSGFCTVNYRPTASNYQLSHLRPCREPNPGLRGGRRECYHFATVAPWGFRCGLANSM